MIAFGYYALAYPTRCHSPDFLLIKHRFIKMNKTAKTETIQLNMNKIHNLSKTVKNQQSTTLEVYGEQIDLHQ